MHETFFTCPYYWQQVSVLVDLLEGAMEWIEDYEVCCRPILFVAEAEEGTVCSFRYERIQ